MRWVEIPPDRTSNSPSREPQACGNLPRVLFGRFAGGTHRQVSAAVLGKPLSVERAESISIGSQWPQNFLRRLRSDTAALQQLLHGSLEEDDLGATLPQQVGVAGRDKGAAAQGYHHGDGRLLKYGAQGASFDLAKVWLAVELKNLANAQLLPEFDFLVEIKECPAKKGRKRKANTGLAGAHKAGQRDDPRRGHLLAGLGISEHFGADGECGDAAND